MPGFLSRPGSAGAFGALLDEYARAAADFCRVAEDFDPRRFAEEHPSDDPDTLSARAICRHVGRAAFGYAYHLRRARGLAIERASPTPDERVEQPADIRPVLADALRLTEETVEPLRDLDGDAVLAIEIPVRWSPQPYNPEVLLEHAICHLLRHRRQLERWSAASRAPTTAASTSSSPAAERIATIADGFRRGEAPRAPEKRTR